jgi:hypothetical protein
MGQKDRRKDTWWAKIEKKKGNKNMKGFLGG